MPNVLLPLLFLLRSILTVMGEYFGSNFTPEHLRNHFVVVYQILDEMIDSGSPFTTEGSVLKEIVRAPSLFNWLNKPCVSVSSVFQGLSSALLVLLPPLPS